MYDLDWAELAFASKKPVNSLQATFIMAPRELSVRRLSQLIKTFLPKGNIILGAAKEPYVAGFTGQPQFKTLQLTSVQSVINKVNQSTTPHKIFSLSYAQTDTDFIIEKCQFKHVVLINGSWQYAFHNRQTGHLLQQKKITFELLSPFCDEAEAKDYENKLSIKISKAQALPKIGTLLTDSEMQVATLQASHYSYDYNFQTGAALGLKSGLKYKFLASGFNKVVPYQTFAMLHGAAREKYFSPPHDLNHYDTVHAEIMLLLMAQKQKIGLKNSSLFINLLPCPPCARMLCETAITEIIYQADHSDGYATYMLEQAGKVVRRLVSQLPAET